MKKDRTSTGCNFYDKHLNVARIICFFKGHKGSRTQLYNEDDEYRYYWHGCGRCCKRSYVFEIRQDDINGNNQISAHTLYGAGYVGEYPFMNGNTHSIQ